MIGFPNCRQWHRGNELVCTQDKGLVLIKFTLKTIFRFPFVFIPISGQVDRVTATETVALGLISSRINPKTRKKIFTAFLLDCEACTT